MKVYRTGFFPYYFTAQKAEHSRNILSWGRTEDSFEYSFDTSKEDDKWRMDKEIASEKLKKAGFNEFDAVDLVNEAISFCKNTNDENAFFAVINRAADMKKEGFSEKNLSKFCSFLLKLPDKSMQKINEAAFSMMKVRSEALNNKSILKNADRELSDEEIENTLFSVPIHLYRTLDAIGEKNFVYAYRFRIDALKDLIHRFGRMYITDREGMKKSDEIFEKLKKYTNPAKTKRYIKTQNELVSLKRQFSAEGISQDKKESLMKEINIRSRKLKELDAAAIKDPKEALEAANIVLGMRDSQYLDELFSMLGYLNSKQKEEKQKLYDFLNFVVLKTLDFSDEEAKDTEVFNLSKSKYLPAFFEIPKNNISDFNTNLKQLFMLIKKNPNKPVIDILNGLEQNIKTKRLFEKYNLNYENWVNYNPDSKIKVSIKTDKEKQKAGAVYNLEEDFNSSLFEDLPEEIKARIHHILDRNGFSLRKRNEPVFDEGLYIGNKLQSRFYKGNERITFDDLRIIITALKAEINSNPFWFAKNDNPKIESAKNNFQNHILKLRYNEIKNARALKDEETINLVVQKADMNDVTHALFLGNDASCCTAVGLGCNQWSAPNYIKNKFISCIEIYDGASPVGNTMCYITLIKGEPALILDNIELKPKYQFNEKIKDAIVDYACKLCKETGNPDMPVYAGPNRHKVNFNEYNCDTQQFSILGSSGDDNIYLDFNTEAHKVEEHKLFSSKLYRIR